MFLELAPGAYAVENRWVAGKAGIVWGSRRALAIDACGYPDEGQAMVAFLRERGWEPTWLALTHGHGDHILGGEAFLGAEVFAHRATPDVIRRQVPGWAERWGQTQSEVAAKLPWPTITFAQELCLDLGDRHVRLLHAPGHSEDGVCVYVEEDCLLYGGDTVVTGIVPAIGDGDSRMLEATLNDVSQLDIEILVPGHGPVMRGMQAIRQCLRDWATYLSDVRAAAREGLIRGDEPAALIESIGFEAYVRARLPAEPFGMRRRHRATAAKIVDEERTVLRATD
jgi:cyclase